MKKIAVCLMAVLLTFSLGMLKVNAVEPVAGEENNFEIAQSIYEKLDNNNSDKNRFIKSTPLVGDYIEPEVAAKLLSRVQLLKGIEGNFTLDEEPTKLEGLMMYIKLLGKEEETIEIAYEPCKFEDFTLRERGYINYAYKNKLLSSIGEDSFNPSDALDENTFFTFLLRALGYDDRAGDFSFNDARSKAFEVGILSESMYNNFVADGFQRYSMAQVCYFALLTKMKGTEKTLAEELVSKGTIERIGATEIDVFKENAFSDDFGDRNTDGWTFYGGSWSAEKGDLIESAGIGYKAIANGTNFTDFVYEVPLWVYNSSSSSDAGLIFRVQNPKGDVNKFDGYYAGINKYNKKIILGKGNSGTGKMTIIKEIPLRKSVKYSCSLKVIANGNNIKVYLDDELYIDIMDNSYSSGAIGVRTNISPAKFYNIFAYELDKLTESTKETEETKETEAIISGKNNNCIKYFYENSKKWANSMVENKKMIELKDTPNNDQTLINFTKELTKGIDNDYEKARVIYDWVRKNIYYDCGPHANGRVAFVETKKVFENKYTNCSGYSMMLATLLNIADIPCIFVEGPTNYDKKSDYAGSHIWVEAYIDGRWVIMDVT